MGVVWGIAVSGVGDGKDSDPYSSLGMGKTKGKKKGQDAHLGDLLRRSQQDFFRHRRRSPKPGTISETGKIAGPSQSLPFTLDNFTPPPQYAYHTVLLFGCPVIRRSTSAKSRKHPDTYSSIWYQ